MSRYRAWRFYLGYAWAKVVLLWAEVRTPRLQMFLYEMLYSAGRPFKAPLPRARWLFRATQVVTAQGHFHIRANTGDMVCASPAFERPDLSRMIAVATSLAERGKRILVLDIGADFGRYAISIGNALKRAGADFRVIGFEPVASSAALFRTNVAANALDEFVDVHPLALWNADGQELPFEYSSTAPGSSGLGHDPGRLDAIPHTVPTRRLDSILSAPVDADVVLLKIDVEGAERQVLEGAGGLLSQVESFLLVEDFVDESIIPWLTDHGWASSAKLTPYNSWWHHSTPGAPSE